MSNKITLCKGERREFTVTVKDGVGALVDLTGAKIYATVATKLEPTAPDIAVNSDDNPAQIFALPQVGATLGQFTWIVLPADTSGLKPREYKYDLWLEWSASNRQPVICAESFTIDGAVTLWP